MHPREMGGLQSRGELHEMVMAVARMSSFGAMLICRCLYIARVLLWWPRFKCERQNCQGAFRTSKQGRCIESKLLMYMRSISPSE